MIMRHHTVAPSFLKMAAITLGLMVAACTSSMDQPQPPAPPVARPATPPPAPPPPANWIDAPQTTGNWRHLASANGSEALFAGHGGAPLFAIQCNRQAGQIRLVRHADGAQNRTRGAAMRILTGPRTQMLNASLQPAGQQGATHIMATLAPRDPLLDAMIFTRGRFGVESEGQPALYLPSWPEIAKVVEDCR